MTKETIEEGTKGEELEQKLVGNCVKCGSTENVAFYRKLKANIKAIRFFRVRRLYSGFSIKYGPTYAEDVIVCPKCGKSFDRSTRVVNILFLPILISLLVIPGISLIVFVLQELDPEGLADSSISFATMIISLIISLIMTIIVIIIKVSPSNSNHYFKGGKFYREDAPKPNIEPPPLIPLNEEEKAFLIRGKVEEDFESLLQEAIELETKGLFKLALVKFVRINNKAPSCGDAWYFRGKAHCALAEFRNALMCFVKAQELGFKTFDPTMYASMAHSNLEIFRPPNLSPKHLKTVEVKLEELFPDVETWTHNGAAFQILGQYEEAYKCYENALELDPTYRPALKNKEFILSIASKKV